MISTQPAGRAIDVSSLFPRIGIATVKGRVSDCIITALGSAAFTLRMSFADVHVAAPPEVLDGIPEEGDLLQVRLVQRRPGSCCPLSVIEAAPATQLYERETSWVADKSCMRVQHLASLRRLLSTLSPPLQAIFFGITVEPGVQRRLFSRIGAIDHHVYPGGLFDQSVRAAEMARLGWHASEEERQRATLAALLFDIGKVWDTRLEFDRPRTQAELAPHRLTVAGAARAVDAVGQSHPEAAQAVRVLLASEQDATGWAGMGSWSRLRAIVREVVRASWGPLLETNGKQQ
jgi:hypothetical protein